MYVRVLCIMSCTSRLGPKQKLYIIDTKFYILVNVEVMYSSDVLICVHVEYNLLYIFLFTGKTVLNFLFLVYPGYRLQYWFWRPLYFFFPFIVYRYKCVYTGHLF